MPLNDPESYLEQCIAALPPEKREAARRAFAEISETGDDSYLSKLLAVLEANGAYAKRIPKEMAEAGGNLVRDMAGIIDKLALLQSQDAGRYEARLTEVLAQQFSGLGEALDLGEVAAGLEKQRLILERLDKLASKADEGSSAGTLFIFLMGCLIGAGLAVWLSWGEYQDAGQTQSLADAGIRMQVEKTEGGNRLTIVGPQMKAGFWQKDATGTVTGAQIDFSDPK